jgi:ATP-dependent Clp protease ATP-binding subunit ClpA
MMLRPLRKQLDEKDLTLELTEAAKDWICDKGYDQVFGARPLRRVIQNSVEDPLSEALLEGRYSAGETIFVDVEDDELKIKTPELATT